MSFDPRSLERLRELGRQLPEPLAEPEKPITPKARQMRHKVETEENPEALFRELMQVSEDGTVPEHLLARLKQLEAARAPSQPLNQPGPTGSGNTDGLPPLPITQAGKGKTTRPKRLQVSPGSEEESLYVAFSQLLLEDDGDEA